MKYSEGPMATHWDPPGEPGGAVLTESQTGDRLEASGKVCSKAALVLVTFLILFVLNKMVSGYKAANLFVFLCASRLSRTS